LISWEYEEMENIQFEVVVQLQGNTVDQFTTGDKSINITNLEVNNNYKVQVTPVLSEADLRGPPANVSVSTQGVEEEPPPEEENEQEENESEDEDEDETENENGNVDEGQQNGDQNPQDEQPEEE